MIEEQTHKEHQRAMVTILEEFDRICKDLQIPYILFAGTLLGAVRHAGFVPWDDDIDVLMLRKDYNRFLSEAPVYLDQSKFYLQKEFSDHWPMFFSKLRLNGTTCLEKFHPKDSKMHQGIYLDIFPCDDAASTAVGRWVQFLSSKVVIAKSLYQRGYEASGWPKKAFIAMCRILPMKPFIWLVRHGGKHGKYVHSFLGGASCYRKNVYLRTQISERTEALFEGKQYPVPCAYDELLRKMFGNYMELPNEKQRRIKIHAVLVDTKNSYEQYASLTEELVFPVATKSIR